MEEKSPAGTAALAAGRLRIFSLHLDFPASARARWAEQTIKKLAGRHWLCSAEMWQLESLNTASSIRKMLQEEAAQADVLIIAVSSLARREMELVHWLDTLANCGAVRRNAGLLIGLLGDETQPAGELDWTVKRLMNCARNTHRDFIWHWMEESASGEPEWLVTHLETFLARKLATLDLHSFEEPAAEFA